MALGAQRLCDSGCGPDVRACPRVVNLGTGPPLCCGSPARKYWCGGNPAAPTCELTCKPSEIPCKSKRKDDQGCSHFSCCPRGEFCPEGECWPNCKLKGKRQCGKNCCEPGQQCRDGKCVGATCGGTRCAPSEECCPGTKKMSRSRCYDPTKQCCTPVAGVLSKWPIKDVGDCPDRVPKKNHKPSANGCGPQNGIKVPDRPFVANFKPACDFHDICYETCGKKQSYCDRRFRTLMEDACDDQFEPESLRHIACYAAAETYYQAVSRIGDEPYADAQKEACLCC